MIFALGILYHNKLIDIQYQLPTKYKLYQPAIKSFVNFLLLDAIKFSTSYPIHFITHKNYQALIYNCQDINIAILARKWVTKKELLGIIQELDQQIRKNHTDQLIILTPEKFISGELKILELSNLLQICHSKKCPEWNAHLSPGITHLTKISSFQNILQKVSSDKVNKLKGLNKKIFYNLLRK